MNTFEKNTSNKVATRKTVGWVVETRDAIVWFGPAVSISLYAYFDNFFVAILSFSVVVLAVMFGFEGRPKTARKEIQLFLFKAFTCGILGCIGYFLVSRGFKQQSAESRDFLDCLGGFLLVLFGCFMFWGSVHFATLTTGSLGGGTAGPEE